MFSRHQLTLRKFWKNYFTIFNCVNLIDNAWSQVGYRNMILAWQKLWPGCVPEQEFERLKTVAPAADVEENSIVEEIILA